MKVLTVMWWCWVALAGAACPLSAQEQPYGFQLTGRSSSTKISFELLSNLIIVPVLINHSPDTLHFILDTGVSSIILFDAKSPVFKTMKPVRRVKISGAGEGQPLQASVTIGNTLRMGHMAGHNLSMVVLDEDVLNLSAYVGRRIDGVFGYELFNHFVVSIDFENRDLLLQKPGKYRYRRQSGEKLPITIEDAKPFLEAVATVSRGQQVPLKLLIDTGAGHALSINLQGSNAVLLPEKHIRAQLGRGLGGLITGSLGRVQEIRLGSQRFQEIIASFPDSVAYSSKLPRPGERHGGIGGEILRRFRVTFNYQQHYMVLKPVRKKFREKFEHNMSGMELVAKGPDLHEFVIESIEKNSPADQSGLRPGDQIMSVDGDYCKGMTISEVYKRLQKGQGRNILLAVVRNNRLFITELTLARVI